jgi:hypothetical protein
LNHRVQSTDARRLGRETWAKRAAGWAAPLNRIMTATLIGFTGMAARAEMDELFPLLPQWEPVFAIRTGGGYKDNVFLSPTQPQGSAFVSGGGDVMVLRLSPDGPQFSFFASADVNHFLEPSHTESAAFALAKLEQDFNATWQGSLTAEYLYYDQFVDVAFLDPATNVAVRATAIRSHILALRPGVEADLPRSFRLSLETPITRGYYDEPLDDYWRTGVKLTLSRRYGYSSQLSISYEPAWRFYDNDPALTAAGDPTPGTHRERFQQEAQFIWRHFWDEAQSWRTTAKLGGLLVEENGGGYADQNQLTASAQIRYRTAPWEITADGRVRRYDYRLQPFSATDLRPRERTEWSASLSLDRELTKHLRVLISYDHEQTLSEDTLEAYRVNTVSGSLQWEF